MVRIMKEFKAHVAHFVPTQIAGECKCRNIHGHTVKITVMLEGNVKEDTRMVEDFTVLKNTIGTFINTILDHKFIISANLLRDDEDFLRLIDLHKTLEQFYITPSKEDVATVAFFGSDGISYKKYIFIPRDESIELLLVGTDIYYDFNEVVFNENTLAFTYKSFSVLNTISTTAEDLAVYFANILAVVVKKLKLKNVKKVGASFHETDTSSASYEISLE